MQVRCVINGQWKNKNLIELETNLNRNERIPPIIQLDCTIQKQLTSIILTKQQEIQPAHNH